MVWVMDSINHSTTSPVPPHAMTTAPRPRHILTHHLPPHTGGMTVAPHRVPPHAMTTAPRPHIVLSSSSRHLVHRAVSSTLLYALPGLVSGPHDPLAPSLTHPAVARAPWHMRRDFPSHTARRDSPSYLSRAVAHPSRRRTSAYALVLPRPRPLLSFAPSRPPWHTCHLTSSLTSLSHHRSPIPLSPSRPP